MSQSVHSTPPVHDAEEVANANTTAFRFPVITTTAAEAESFLTSHRRQWAEAGACPVILGGRASVLLLEEGREPDATDVDEILRKADSLDVAQWFVEREDSDAECYGDVEIGEFPDDLHGEEDGCFHALRVAPSNSIYIARIPTARSFEIPAFLEYGGWNECPFSYEHVAIWRRWHDRFGAEICVVTEDTVEAIVSRPPTEPGVAMTLAREHFLYCEDIVHQGVGSLAQLAATLLNARQWFFWWD